MQIYVSDSLSLAALSSKIIAFKRKTKNVVVNLNVKTLCREISKEKNASFLCPRSGCSGSSTHKSYGM